MVRNDWCDTGAELFLHFVFSNADPTLSITFHIISVQMLNEGRTTMGIGIAQYAETCQGPSHVAVQMLGD